MNFKSDMDDLRAAARKEYISPTVGQGTIAAFRNKRFGSKLYLALWLGLRLALAATITYFLADEVTWLVTLLAIHLVGNWPERAGLGLLLGFSLAAGLALIGDFSSKGRYIAALTLGFGLCFLLFRLIPGASVLPFSLFLTTILALNLFPARCWAGFWSNRRAGWAGDLLFILVGIGWAELLLLRPFGGWWLARWAESRKAVGQDAILSFSAPDKLATCPTWRDKLVTCPTWLPGVILVAGLGALLPSAYNLASLHRGLFPDPAVQMFAQGNFNELKLDIERRVLYTGGYGVNYLLAYDLEALEAPPLQSPVENGHAQGFGYNPAEQELYVYNQERQQLLILDATRLELKRAMDVPQVSPGDAWVIWDNFSDRIIIASEADESGGSPFMVLDRKSGKVLDLLDIEPGNVLLHPSQPLLYLSFFRRRNELLLYDTQSLKVIKRVSAEGRLDRMAFMETEAGLKLLVASPVEGVLRQFEPQSLEAEGLIPSLFGVRTLAFDPVRNLLLTGSLVNNKVEVIDLAHNQRRSYYTTPWLRTIALDQEAGVAYISSHEGLFKLRYAEPLPVSQR